ncbi:fumarylacetoacetase [bacterium]|nr:fumarylacetoacetase [bacterium]
MKTWLSIPENSDFSIHNLPFGIVVRDGGKTPAVAIGDSIIDLAVCSKLGIFDPIDCDPSVFSAPVLNDFIACGKQVWSQVRKILQEQLTTENSILHSFQDKALIERKGAEMAIPVHVGDYTDFYSSKEHATNVGKMFRPDSEPLLPNWKHIPVGYHGRASSIVISGTGLKRPYGQTIKPGESQPDFGPSQRVDIELEMAYVIGKANKLGEPVHIKDAEDHIFGKLIFNDWSARDIQKWEYVPLGPFLGKNFGSTVSPWIVTMEALEPFRTNQVDQSPEVLPYLQGRKDSTFDIKLDVTHITPEGVETHIAHSNFKYLYWSMAQQLTHHTVNGCNLNIGDMMASGTISGQEKSSFGSMLELSWAGKEPIELKDGTSRKFLLDGDSIRINAYCEKDGNRIGFGSCEGTILPNPEY